jgi:hypothetical protein
MISILFTQLLALALIVHQLIFYFQYGESYLTVTLCPVLGLRLSKRKRCVVHMVAVMLCVALLFQPQSGLLRWLLLAALTLLIANYSLRLSNHLIVAWFLLFFCALEKFPEALINLEGKEHQFMVVGGQLVMIFTWLLPLVHKLNPQFFSPHRSCAATLTRLYLQAIGIQGLKFEPHLKRMAIYGTLAVEAAIPVLLLIPAAVPYGVLLAVLFHMQMGFLGQPHFSSLMYAGLLLFLPEAHTGVIFAGLKSLGWMGLTGCLIAGGLAGARFGITKIFHYRRGGLYLQILFGGYSALAILAAVQLFHVDQIPVVEWNNLTSIGQGLVLLVMSFYLLNGLMPYLGLKTEYSLAMFSNIRPVHWQHYLVRSPLLSFGEAGYIKIESLEGLPSYEACQDSLPLKSILDSYGYYQRWLYQHYYLHDSLALLCSQISPTPVIKLIYIRNGRRVVIEDYARDQATLESPRLQLLRYPYMLPADSSHAHCA